MRRVVEFMAQKQLTRKEVLRSTHAYQVRGRGGRLGAREKHGTRTSLVGLDCHFGRGLEVLFGQHTQEVRKFGPRNLRILWFQPNLN